MISRYFLLHKSCFQRFSVFVAFLMSGFFSSGALSYDLPNITIPAASCIPHVDSEQKIKIDDGVWAFRAGQTGAATLYCPLPLKSSSASPLISLSNFRVYYLDSDGSNADVSVAVRLMHRKSNASGIWFSGSGWISNTVFQADQNKGWRVESHNPGGTNLNLAINQIYTFRVTLTRSSAVSVGFAGIDFEPALAALVPKGECCGPVLGSCVSWCNIDGGCDKSKGQCDTFLLP